MDRMYNRRRTADWFGWFVQPLTPLGLGFDVKSYEQLEKTKYEHKKPTTKPVEDVDGVGETWIAIDGAHLRALILRTCDGAGRERGLPH